MATLGLIAFFIWMFMGGIGTIFTPLAWLSNPVEVSTIAFGVSFVITLMWCTLRHGKEIKLKKKHTVLFPMLIGFLWSLELGLGYQGADAHRGCLEIIPALITVIVFAYCNKQTLLSLKGSLRLLFMLAGLTAASVALNRPSGSLLSILMATTSLCIRTLRLVLFKHASQKWIHPNFVAISMIFLSSSLFTLPWTIWLQVQQHSDAKHIGTLFPEGTLAALFLLSQVTLLYHLPSSFDYVGLGLLRDVAEPWLVDAPTVNSLQISHGFVFMAMSILYTVPKIMTRKDPNVDNDQFWTLEDVATLEHLTDILNAYPSELDRPTVNLSDRMSDISLM